MKIVNADERHLDFVVEECKNFSKIYGEEFFLNESTARKVMSDIFNNHVVFIAEDDNKTPVGFISGYFTKHPYNPSLYALTESFWWVKEEARNTRASLMLLNHFVEFGEEYADIVTLCLDESSPDVEKHYLKRGFRLKERTYIKEVK